MKPSIRSVSQINDYIKKSLESDIILRNLVVKGEVSGVARAKSGHIYFDIKDKDSSISCVLYGFRKLSLSHLIQNGVEVVLKGSISIYKQRGVYQINVTEVGGGDVGKLHEQYLKLKKDMDGLGYFDVLAKKDLPSKITNLALVTSATSAAIIDFLTVLKRRNPFINVEVFDVSVQGANCPKEVSASIVNINKQKRHDLIVLTRGGGSREELFVFNDKEICTQIYNSEIPVAVAIGHQRDESLAELCADIRSGTPSSLAEIVTENFYRDNIEKIELAIKNLKSYAKIRIDSEKNALLHNRKALLSEKNNKFLMAHNLINNIKANMEREVDLKLETARKENDMKLKLLKSYDSTNVLKRGYSVVYKDGKVAKLDAIKPDDLIDIKSDNLTIKARVLEVSND